MRTTIIFINIANKCKLKLRKRKRNHNFKNEINFFQSKFVSYFLNYNNSLQKSPHFLNKKNHSATKKHLISVQIKNITKSKKKNLFFKERKWPLEESLWRPCRKKTKMKNCKVSVFGFCLIRIFIFSVLCL